jgi:hypothetical protein
LLSVVSTHKSAHLGSDLQVDSAPIAVLDSQTADPAIEVAEDVVEIVAELVGGDGSGIACKLERREDGSATAIATWDWGSLQRLAMWLTHRSRNTNGWQSVGDEAQESEHGYEEKHLSGRGCYVWDCESRAVGWNWKRSAPIK